MKKFINDAWSFGKCHSRKVGSLLAVAAFALVILSQFSCTDYVSQIENERDEWRLGGSYDCTVTDGIKVVYPAGSETFKVNDEISVVFGTTIDDGYRIIFKKNASDAGIDLLDGSFDLAVPADGKTCQTLRVKLDAEKGVEATSTGIIRVVPYNKQNKGSNSSTFSVVDENAKSSNGSYDCTVTDGVKVVYPAGGETFKVNDEISVVFGTAIEDSYRIIFKNGSSDVGMDLLDESIDVKTDGKTCNEVKVKLSADRGGEATSTGIIRVAPYNRQNKGVNSNSFNVLR